MSGAADGGGSEQNLPKRFYQAVDVSQVAGDDGADHGAVWAVLLDGRSVKTPGKSVVAVASVELAEALAAEWRAQGERINPMTMPKTRIINSALDGVCGREPEVAADIVQFSGSDLICYRAKAPDDLVALQAAHWDRVLIWAGQTLGARFILAQGVMPIEQPGEALNTIAREVGAYGALQLAALHVMTTLTGSALLALAHARGLLDAEAAWVAAHVDEDFQIGRWGGDEEAAERRARRWAEFQAASKIFALA